MVKKDKKIIKHLEKVQKILDGTIQALATALAMRDPYTAEHQRRVTKLAYLIAKKMKLALDQIEAVRVAATLHDVGKLYVPAEILAKPCKLSEMEMNIVKEHTKVGYKILNKEAFPWPIAKIVLQHHERMDGSGYPLGCSGKDITIEARILAVADVVEAMSSHRPYRPALGVDKALKEILKNRGILYDAKVVDACAKLLSRCKKCRPKKNPPVMF